MQAPPRTLSSAPSASLLSRPQLVEELARRLEEERAAEEREQQRQKQTDAARRRVTELEQELAAARAALRSAPRQTCPDCGATGLRNVGVHRAKAHGYQKGAVS